MKFIVDAQLPQYLSDFLKKRGYDSIHTLELPLKNKTPDKDLIGLCNAQDRIMITKDADFLESYLLNSDPKKLLLIKTGNISNDKLISIFALSIEKICDLFKTHSLIELSEEEIAIHLQAK